MQDQDGDEVVVDLKWTNKGKVKLIKGARSLVHYCDSSSRSKDEG